RRSFIDSRVPARPDRRAPDVLKIPGRLRSYRISCTSKNSVTTQPSRNSPKGGHMRTRLFYFTVAAVAIAAILVASPGRMSARQNASDIKVDPDDIGGVVTSSKGPEAGVWVIAETTDLPTRLIKIVVTDDRGRYVVPDLPKANYNMWVRGYG